MGGKKNPEQNRNSLLCKALNILDSLCCVHEVYQEKSTGLRAEVAFKRLCQTLMLCRNRSQKTGI